MSESLGDWLALREAADGRARSESLVRATADRLPQSRPLCFLDLGTGTGANIRYLSERLPQPHQWLAIDRDPALLAQVPSGVERRCLELGPLDVSVFAGRHLVTASALLDLVSVSWLERLARRCREAGAAALFALTYDGRSTCLPAEDEDELIRELFNRHQRQNDKGFGRAAGPDAAAAALAAFDAAGYVIQHEASDWVVAPEEAATQRVLVNGWAEAALEMDRSKAPIIRDWLARRLAHVDDGQSRIRVGHQDIAAWLK